MPHVVASRPLSDDIARAPLLVTHAQDFRCRLPLQRKLITQLFYNLFHSFYIKPTVFLKYLSNTHIMCSKTVGEVSLIGVPHTLGASKSFTFAYLPLVFISLPRIL